MAVVSACFYEGERVLKTVFIDGALTDFIPALRYGKDAKGDGVTSPIRADAPKKWAAELQGCANRYVGKCVIITGGSKVPHISF